MKNILNKKFWEELIAYLSTGHNMDRIENTGVEYFYLVACVFVATRKCLEPLPSNVKVGTDTQTAK
jgi:hypothetical protein